MLTHLSIKNYALIEDLSVEFAEGFTTITGETGAGKSILLGALSLVLGKRADLSTLKDKTSKCTIEAEFRIDNYGLREWFKENDLDYEDHSILRREILPSGKSRAFVNDTPVTLDILSGLGERLVDIHSQHQTLKLTENTFQFKVVDALADNNSQLQEYRKNLKIHRDIVGELKDLTDYRNKAATELDYNSFLLQELEGAKLEEGILEQLESEQEQLSNVEGLMELLSQAHQLLNEEQMGLVSNFSQLNQITQKLAGFGEQFNEVNTRVASLLIELNDVTGELEHFNDTIEPNPARLEEVNGQLQLFNNLFKKHQVSNIRELKSVKELLTEKVDTSLNIDEKISKKEEALSKQKRILEDLSAQMSKKREKVIPELKKLLLDHMQNLGMPSANFKIEIHPSNDLRANGMDDLVFLFSANKGSDYGELKKVASGGELSRIMLAIKSILSSYEKLPTLMFDEIDTGVSGEISNKMGAIMKAMGEHMQVFSITHLPQVASKGKQQFKVFKEEVGGTTNTRMKILQDQERIHELAEMLGGKSFSESAMNHAKELLVEG